MPESLELMSVGAFTSARAINIASTVSPRRSAKLMLSIIRKLAFLACLFLILPANAEKAKPFIYTPANGHAPYPVVLWLHGYRGYSPNGYFPSAKAEAMQKHADTIGAVIIGFPATTDLGD